MSQQALELRVEVRRLGNEFLAVTKRADGQEICSNRFQHDARKMIHHELLRLMERSSFNPDDTLPGIVLASDTLEKTQIARYGQRLYTYLFGDGKVMQEFFDRNNAERRPVRVILALYPEVTLLWKLPWEYLYDGREFPCLNGQMLLNRVPGEMSLLTPTKTALPLRMLAVIAGPEDQPEVDVEQELMIMQDALDEVQRSGLVHVDYLNDATLVALQNALSQADYHVLHYIGHGLYNQNQQRGFLCFESSTGRTVSVDAEQLKPLLANEKHLRLAVLSACQSAKASGKEAFDSVAIGLLQANIPAVLALQVSLLDESASELVRVLYTELTQGKLLDEAVLRARLALRELDNERQLDRRRFDWGVPTIYLRAHNLQLVDPDARRMTSISIPPGQNISDLILPQPFVGRQSELRTMREALRQGIPTIYVQGPDGVGKSALVAKLIEHPGVDLDDVLVIHCNQLQQPVDALGQIAEFWLHQGQTGHAQAAARLLDVRRDPKKRAARAAQMAGERRYLIVFDDLDVWFDPGEANEPALVGDQTMRHILEGLVALKTNTTFLFITHCRWAGLAAIPMQNRLELQLSELTQRQALLLMNTLPRIRSESLDLKQAAYRYVGGYPHILKLLDGWLSGEQDLSELLSDSSRSGQPTEEWRHYLLNATLSRLPSAEREALMATAIIKGPLCTDPLNKLVQLGAKEARALLEKWRGLSLIQFHHINEAQDACYLLHRSVRQYLREHLDEDRHRTLHARAAAYYGAPFLKEARQRVMGHNSTSWDDEQIEWLARSGEGVLGIWVRQTGDLNQARQIMARALAWQQHLSKAGQSKAAAEIVEAILPVLVRWGQRDAAKALLQRSIATKKGRDRAIALIELASLTLNEGHLQEALDIYDKVYNTFAALSDKANLATVLSQMSQVYQALGKYEQAIESAQVSLKIQVELKDEAAQASNLQQLAMLNRQQGKYEQAMGYNLAAEKLAKKLGKDSLLADVLYTQGLIFNKMNCAPEAFDRFRKSMEIARRIGDNEQIADSLTELGKLMLVGRKTDEALGAFKEVLAIQQRLGTSKIGETLELLGCAEEQRGKLNAALEVYQQARRVYQKALPTNLPNVEQRIAHVQKKIQRKT